jgi:hypothetical protein
MSTNKFHEWLQSSVIKIKVDYIPESGSISNTFGLNRRKILHLRNFIASRRSEPFSGEGTRCQPVWAGSNWRQV